MFRFDNPDALLVLVMTLAGYTITRAIESGRTRWILLTGALLGLGYLTKMLQAFLVLPAFALVYLWAGQPALGKRSWQLLAGAGALVVAAGWWVVDRPAHPGRRPAVRRRLDGQQHPAAHVRLQRPGPARRQRELARRRGRRGGQAGRRGGPARRHRHAAGGPPSGGGGGGGNSLFGGATGITRLFQSDMGSQISWLLPAALIMLAALVWLTWRAPRTDRTRAAALLWGGWLVLTGLVFSYMSGIIHPYYTVALAPAIGALIGVGSVALWRIRDRWPARVALAGTLLVTAGWAWVLLGRSPDWMPWLRVVIALAGAAAAGLILASRTAAAAVRRPDPGARRIPVAGPGGRAGRSAGLQHRHRGHRARRVDPDGRPDRDQRLRAPGGSPADRAPPADPVCRADPAVPAAGPNGAPEPVRARVARRN